MKPVFFLHYMLIVSRCRNMLAEAFETLHFVTVEKICGLITCTTSEATVRDNKQTRYPFWREICHFCKFHDKTKKSNISVPNPYCRKTAVIINSLHSNHFCIIREQHYTNIRTGISRSIS